MPKRKRNVPDGTKHVPQARGKEDSRRNRRGRVVKRQPPVDKTKAGRALDSRLRSGLERKLADGFREAQKSFFYESHKLEYTVPEQKHRYIPDFSVPDYRAGGAYGCVFFETKGRLTSADRKKMLLVFKDNRGLNLWMVFPKPDNKIRKGSPTTYSMWCSKNSIPWISLDDLLKIIKEDNYIDILRRRKEVMGLG